MRAKTIFVMVLAGGGVTTALAQNPFFSEIGANPPGDDAGYEFIEIEGIPDALTTGLKVIIIDGKNGNQGTVLKVLSDTNSFGTIGSNGVLLLRPSVDLSGAEPKQFSPVPTAWTRVYGSNSVSGMANGSQTYVLGFGTAPALGNVITGPISGFTVYDAVAYKHAAADFEYAEAIGGSSGTNLGVKPALMGTLYRQITGNATKGTWAGGLLDLSKGNPGPYAWRTGSGNFFGPSGWSATSPVTGPDPGLPNYRFRTIAGTLSVSPSDYQGTVGGAQSFVVQVYKTNGTTLMQTANVSITPSGTQAVAWSFTLDPSIKDDRVQIRIKGPTFLAKRTANLTVATSTSNIAFTLLNGDVDGNNVTATDDYLLISNSFDTSFGDPGYSLNADLNKDSAVGTDDYLILNANFDLEGDN